jgi:hypothetical protein
MAPIVKQALELYLGAKYCELMSGIVLESRIIDFGDDESAIGCPCDLYVALRYL